MIKPETRIALSEKIEEHTCNLINTGKVVNLKNLSNSLFDAEYIEKNFSVDVANDLRKFIDNSGEQATTEILRRAMKFNFKDTTNFKIR